MIFTVLAVVCAVVAFCGVIYLTAVIGLDIMEHSPPRRRR
jgi:hypothetical protein